MIALLVLALPLAEAHITGARPILQRAQFERLPDIQPLGVGLRAELILRSDQVSEPLRHLITHVIDPSTGLFYVEYRPDASVEETAFYTQWRIERIVEFHDQNVDGLFQPELDTVVKSFRLNHYDWHLDAIQDVSIADVTGKSAVWTGNLTGAPDIRLEVAIAGKDFTDEGALVRAQDVAVYLDILNLPEREVGSLYAIEMPLVVQRDTALSFHRVENTSTALLADGDLRRGLLVWGGEGYLDGQEVRLDATIRDERVEGDNKTARLTLHLPTIDREMRFVMVSGVEYANPAQRGSPGPELGLVLVAAAAIALARSRR